MQPNTFAFMSRTGGGKGTQAKLLSEKTGFEVFSSGAKFRELRNRGDALSERIRQEYDKGLLMPSWFSTFLFQEVILYRSPEKGIIFEGACRKEFEAKMFHEVMIWLGREYSVIYLDISEETSMRRQLLRSKTDTNRVESNTEEKIRVRFREFDEHTAKALAFFREQGKVIDIDGEPSVEAVHSEIISKVLI